MYLFNLGANLYILVLTGGPCGGKTSGLPYIISKLSARGYKVLVVSEVATKFFSSGVGIGEHDLTSLEFQEAVLRNILSEEAAVIEIAKIYRDRGQKVVVLCDRGTMDGEAYIGAEAYQKLILKIGETPRNLCEGRYHGVFHLRTAADGAEEFYTCENNETRRENVDEARILDMKTLNAWSRHFRPRVIDNSTDFQGKMKRLLQEICCCIGEPVPSGVEKKFLIKNFDQNLLKKLNVPLHRTEITQTYLLSDLPENSRRVRKRGTAEEGFLYFFTLKKEEPDASRLSHERIIDRREYETLLEFSDFSRRVIRKTRNCFFWRNQFFELDLFSDGLVILEVELTEEKEEMELPPLGVLEDVTHNPRYRNSQLARKV
ncbi:MAG TPA: AAA family ATPase [Candidatus Paceibacterota bacterium]|nr:AAA family ATPase [Candidatus Paceibacterota bacterium]